MYISYVSLSCVSVSYISVSYVSVSYVSVSYISVSYVSVTYVSVSYISVSYVSVTYISVSYISVSYVSVSYISVIYISVSCISVSYVSVSYISAKIFNEMQNFYKRVLELILAPPRPVPCISSISGHQPNDYCRVGGPKKILTSGRGSSQSAILWTTHVEDEGFLDFRSRGQDSLGATSRFSPSS